MGIAPTTGGVVVTTRAGVEVVVHGSKSAKRGARGSPASVTAICDRVMPTFHRAVIAGRRRSMDLFVPRHPQMCALYFVRGLQRRADRTCYG